MKARAIKKSERERYRDRGLVGGKDRERDLGEGRKRERRTKEKVGDMKRKGQRRGG